MAPVLTELPHEAKKRITAALVADENFADWTAAEIGALADKLVEALTVSTFTYSSGSFTVSPANIATMTTPTQG